MITIHTWTYSGDVLTVQSVTSVVAACDRLGWRMGAEYRMVVMDDGCQPSDQEVREACLRLGVIWRESNYWRAGNLRGQVCILGMLQDMMSSMTSPQDVAVKMDPDTIMLDARWLADFVSDDRAQITGCDDRGNMYGMLYALRAGLLSEVLASVESCPAHLLAPEDQVIGYRGRLLCADQAGAWVPMSLRTPGVIRGSINGPDGVIAPYHWHAPDASPDLYQGCRAVNLGTSLSPIAPDLMRSVAQSLITNPSLL